MSRKNRRARRPVVAIPDPPEEAVEAFEAELAKSESEPTAKILIGTPDEVVHALVTGTRVTEPTVARCFACGDPCTDDQKCPGCQMHICPACNVLTEYPSVKHSRNVHHSEPEEENSDA